MSTDAVGALVLNSAASVCSLVFVNAATPFIVLRIWGSHRVASISGNLAFADELLALPCVLVWGYIVDTRSLNLVASAAHLLTACGLLATSRASSYLGLLLARLLTSLGHSGLTTTFTAGISLLSICTQEEQPLIESDYPIKSVDSSARLSGYVGTSAGLGALAAVFGFLRLPPHLAPDETNHGLHMGLQRSFYLLAILQITASAVCFWKLRPDVPADAQRRTLRDELRQILLGFRLVFKDAGLAIATVSGMTARAATIVASLFIPLYIASSFARSGRCDMDPKSPPTKEGCKEAYILSSSLTGTIQLVSLLCAAPIGYLGSKRSGSTWQVSVLAISYVVGSVGWVLWAALPGQDPSHFALSVPASIALGYSQIAGTVLSLSLVAQGRIRLSKAQKDDQTNIAGALSGAYSFFGGLAILIISQAGSLVDVWPGAAFVIMAILYGGLAAVSGWYCHHAKAECCNE